ncbi:Hsp20/alpha crystallin family protein [Haloplanus litoreus]|uniref:Hsp20/alpha crystallin family protein n=1 Tax=Haloplanus litoreus TaxID=767515 RepID=A0ABD5ZYY6_9EURY
MENQQFAGEDERFVRRYDYEDGWVVAADVGVADDRLTTDVVDGTAIVLVDGRTELEFDVPGSVESVDTNNGVLVVRGEL